MNDQNGRTEFARDAWAVDGFAPLPGDAVSLPGGDRRVVETVYLCSEPSGDDLTRWSWIVFADGRLLEVAPRGCALYEPPQVLARGTGRFLELVAQDGALVRFEEHVREGTWEARPVRLTLGRRRWRLTSTGTVTAQRLGPIPAGSWGQFRSPHPQPLSLPRERGASAGGELSRPLPRLGDDVGAADICAAQRGGGWGTSSDVPPEEQDVYFTLAGLADPDALGLGLWATDVVLAFGRRLGDAPSAAGLAVVADEA
jgi:hypothetical protein